MRSVAGLAVVHRHTCCRIPTGVRADVTGTPSAAERQ
jgi:hypothetical protein